MRQEDIDRICAETLRGRFGPRLVSPTEIEDLICPPAHAGGAATIRDAAIWTSARTGNEQGKP